MYVALALFLAVQAPADDAAAGSAESPTTTDTEATPDGAAADPAPAEETAPAEEDAPATPAETAPAAPAAAQSAGSDLPGLDAALDELFGKGGEVVRVAVAPISDDDEARAKTTQNRVVRALLERGREEVVTPSMVSRVLGAGAAEASADAYAKLAADHVVLGEVVDAAGQVSLRLRLLHVETGGIVGEISTAVDAVGRKSSASTRTVRGGVDEAVAQLVDALQALPGELRYQRVAVAPLEAQGQAVVEGRVERYAQVQLSDALKERGYLVVERQQLGAAMQQLALGAAMDDASAPELGKLLDAQAIVLGSVSEAGEVFQLNLRAVSVEGGAVLGTATAALPREGVVTLANDAIETRTPAEALFRSLVAPGWGQFYNRQPVTGIAFGVATYGAALTTLGLGVASAISYSLYDGYGRDGLPAGKTSEEAQQEAKALREQTNILITATAVSGGLTTVFWGAGAAEAFLGGFE
jgi:hypothetical protein